MEGATYTGIRCQYFNLTAGTNLTACQSNTSLLTPPTNPGTYAGTAISPADWYAVYTQLHAECQDAAEVQGLFSSFTNIITNVFIDDSTAIIPLADDVGLSGPTPVNNVVPIDIIEGLLYTVLSATGDPAAGVFANLLETAVNTTLAAQQGQALTQKLITTVGTLYSDLGSQLTAVTSQANNGENAILMDWGRLQQIDPLTGVTGYNGLGLGTTDETDIEAAAIKGYQLTVMQQLMPISGAQISPAFANQGNSSTGLPSYTFFDYLTFGSYSSNPLSYNFGIILYPPPSGGTATFPTSQVMQTDILDNGANPFELFNGINGWGAMPVGTSNIGCAGLFMTLFNQTSNDLQVKIAPSQGYIASPGADYDSSDGINQGCECDFTAELRPYGYLSLVAGGNGKNGQDLAGTVSIASGGLSFDYSTSGCDDNGAVTISNLNSGTLTPFLSRIQNESGGETDGYPGMASFLITDN